MLKHIIEEFKINNNFRKPSSGILRHVFLVRTDVSEECIASIIRTGESRCEYMSSCLQMVGSQECSTYIVSWQGGVGEWEMVGEVGFE
jgi:hypothetical protein